MSNDTISDMLTRIRNANLAKRSVAQVPSTKMTRNIASILLEEKFISRVEEIKEEDATSWLLLSLIYGKIGKSPILSIIKRVSKPGLRVYANRKELPKVLGGIGIAIVSTSKGVMSDHKARHLGLGGEILCYIC
ncbi:ribosomal protein S8 (plastid) [Cryptomonas paramecium]|uniref:Ribosomal protein S8 n=1 Tax=Cryptomonas paramaecium TaxID=2898 RepID=D2ISA7_9CRYP|nr:ribosomal protein S8 [Cryptomonas paramecium]ACT46799.1 ribosomal protein S8 [Cryptomonas paramecium]BDA97996.1 ribosomal protein S8 [Cryptomonas paramecium]